MACKILVVAAHADDDILGCGATMAKHVIEGDEVKVIFLTDGVSSRTAHQSDSKTIRREAAAAALSKIGVSDHVFCDFPDNAMDSVPLLEVTQHLEGEVSGYSPDVVYTHSPSDLNVDHCIAFKAVLTTFRPQPGSPKPTILSFEIPSSTEWNVSSVGTAFLPNWYVDVSSTMELKIASLIEYSEEMRTFPHARSLEAVSALATWRGASVGVASAEAFMLARHIQ